MIMRLCILCFDAALLISSSCAYGDFVNVSEGLQYKSEASLTSPNFQLFSYRGYDSLYIECQAILCKTSDDVRCDQVSRGWWATSCFLVYLNV